MGKAEAQLKAVKITTLQNEYIRCHTCGKTQQISRSRCDRCNTLLRKRIQHSVQKTLAYLITAILLFLPANLLPVMHTLQLGQVTPNTIIGGVVVLWAHGSYAIATVILVASIVVPTLKILVMGFLCFHVSYPRKAEAAQISQLFQITEIVGRWSMVDIFVVATLVALVQVQSIYSIEPGPAAIAFAGVVVSTMLAAKSFDSRLIWDAKTAAEFGKTELTNSKND